MNQALRALALLSIALALVSCSKFRRIQKSPDWRLKYDAALEYYNKGKYYKSTVLLDEILPIISGTKEAEAGNYYRAYGYFHQKQYIVSAHHFNEFYRVYGRSQYAEEAVYMHAYSIFLQSPEHNLDQSSSLEAVDALQLFITRYPNSEHVKDAEKHIGELQVKLETKAYNNALLYHKLRRYKSALVVFDNFHKDYPDSEYREEIAYLEIISSYEYARVSIESKQEERYRKTISLYEAFVDRYPTSSFLIDAQTYYVKSQDELKALLLRLDK